MTAARNVSLGIVAVAVAVIGGALVYRAVLQRENAKALIIATPDGIAEAGYIRIGGIDQWIQIRGDDRRNPVVLLLNGGPGASWLRATQAFVPWEKYFTVVQWDQRGAGRTFEKSGESVAKTMTISRMVSDGLEVSNYLRAHLKKDKIILLGHSWGSILGVHMVKARPDLFYAFVGTGQVESMPKALRAAYAASLAKLRQEGDESAVRELSAVGPPPYRDYATIAKAIKASRGTMMGDDVPSIAEPGGGFAAPGYSLTDDYYLVRGSNFSQRTLLAAALREDLTTLGMHFDVPVFMFEGSADMLPIADARDYFNRIDAPKKAFVAFSGGNHFVLFARPDAFLKEMVEKVRPLAKPSLRIAPLATVDIRKSHVGR
ncbi:MAG: alpha/beta hydrolase [Alphaproteobacteria bacterium]|nr:alpha/beta hydrolase [Alphaproteobacteria bacterium]